MEPKRCRRVGVEKLFGANQSDQPVYQDKKR